jgi:hypothetical protein
MPYARVSPVGHFTMALYPLSAVKFSAFPAVTSDPMDMDIIYEDDPHMRHGVPFGTKDIQDRLMPRQPQAVSALNEAHSLDSIQQMTLGAFVWICAGMKFG